jgi:hypothetical protein
MEELNMARKFRYHAAPDEVKSVLTDWGYVTEDLYDGDHKEVVGFNVCETSVQLNYDLVVGTRVVGYGLIVLRESLKDTPEMADRSQKLYQKLHRRFGRPSKHHDSGLD